MSSKLTLKKSSSSFVFMALSFLLVTMIHPHSRAVSKSYLILLDLHNQEKVLLKNLESPALSNPQKVDAIREQKNFTELTLQKLVIESSGDPATELTKPMSPLSIAFKVGDLISVLSQLSVDGSGRFSPDSCNMTKGQLYITARDNEGIAPLERLQLKLDRIINRLCGV
jgi:hypothetical protein